MDSVYFDNEPAHGINAYFPWGHRYFKHQAEFEQFLAAHYPDDAYQLVEITDENYQSLLLKGVFHAI
ncbi:hypothetical protein ACSTDZ_20295 [Vibrio vulnificus]|jgi:hypothetical protein|uniref:Phage protein n=1 Tax=Vibrio vulnificus TaxID=672 RepID=A0AAQ1I0K8_VIBVL|nr:MULTISPECIES: hypothetical protein [Vibrio]ADV88800.1 hypothetical protein VVMO6_03778 [Vibrio vulnificus MO6-24/O]AIL72849.1 hypothetical protein VV93_v1c37930 [Vibrio vulnificus]ASC59305.1 Phage protein [Vibrio vulnificus]AXX59856.1 Phage protein [Vibrio vulnificus]EGQ7831170.1 hypothetical protein [Vibrio vulnificus]